MTHRCMTGLIALALTSPLLAADDPGAPLNCRTSKASTIAHFWELSDSADCDTFSLRGYRPISLMGSFSNGVNRQMNMLNHHIKLPIPCALRRGVRA
mgnify:CR=1 FL=1